MKKYKSLIISVLSITFVILVTIYSKDKIFDNNNPISDTQTLNTSNTTDKLELTKAKVTKIIDGDTIWVDIEGKSYKVRFIGINCPEYTKEIEPFGKEATEFTTQYLEDKTIYLQKDVSDTDDYDRLLRYVWTEEVNEINEENISNYLFNAKLVQEGLAQSNYYKPDISLQSYLEDFEKEAKSNGKEMWQ